MPVQGCGFLCMEMTAILAAYGTQVRQNTGTRWPGATVEADDQAGSGFLWSGLDPGNAHAVIAAQVSLFRKRQREL
jgi:hypothetical protein